MTLATVPDYCQKETEDALRQQVGWLEREAGLDDGFFGRLLRYDAGPFAAWRESRASLPSDDADTLRALWHTTLHLLSFLGCEEGRMRGLFGSPLPEPGPGRPSPAGLPQGKWSRG